MEDKQLKLKKKAQKFIDNNGNPMLAQLDATIEIADKLDELTQAVKSIPQTEIPEPPEIPEVDFSETNRLLQELLAESKKKEQSEEITYSISPSDQAKLRGKDGKDGRNGKDGLNGLDGKNGKDGKDGSPDTRKQIVDKINLGGPEKIKASEITGLPEFTREIIHDNRAVLGQVETPLKAGANITITKDAQGANVISSNSSGGTVGPGTINEIAYFNATDTITSLPVATYPSLTELSYVKGVTSAIQTQLNAKQASDTQLTSLAGLSYTGNALKVVRVNAGETDFELATLTGGSGLTHPEVMSRVSLRF